MTGELATVDPDTARRLLHQMVRIRRFEERCVELYSAAKIRGFLHLYVGEEAVATGIIDQLRPEDSIVATYRDHGHALARGVSMRSITAEMFGRQEGCSRGRGGSMHLFDADTNFYGGNAIVAAGLPVAAGLALAAKRTGSEAITACFFGEGAVAGVGVGAAEATRARGGRTPRWPRRSTAAPPAAPGGASVTGGPPSF